MITQIGLVAGDIWHYLDIHKKVMVNELFKNVEKPKELIWMGVGWLAREGHVLLVEKDGDYEMTLRDKV